MNFQHLDAAIYRFLMKERSATFYEISSAFFTESTDAVSLALRLLEDRGVVTSEYLGAGKVVFKVVS